MDYPILFLDIDGVLNGHDWHEGACSNTIRKTCIDALSLILQKTACRVVLSSAWRYMLLCGAMKPMGFEYLLRTHGTVGIVGKILGTTCADEQCCHCGLKGRRGRSALWDVRGYFVCKECLAPSSRGDQITRWLDEHQPTGRYVVLDDEDYGITDAGHPLVKTNGVCGLTEKDARAGPCDC